MVVDEKGNIDTKILVFITLYNINIIILFITHYNINIIILYFTVYN